MRLLLLLRANALAFALKMGHAPISFECLFSMTLPPGMLDRKAPKVGLCRLTPGRPKVDPRLT